LDADDAVELGELLDLLARWFASDREGIGASIARFIGDRSYGIDDLRGDVSRFAFMLGGDGDLLIGRPER
jgi:hypothetical protein